MARCEWLLVGSGCHADMEDLMVGSKKCLQQEMFPSRIESCWMILIMIGVSGVGVYSKIQC